MKKVWKKVLAGMLAVVMVLTSFSFDFGKGNEVEAASSAGGFMPGKVLADVDFTETNVRDLDDVLIASEGTSADDMTTASGVSRLWKKGEDQEVVNAASGGTATLTNPLLNPARMVDGSYDNNTSMSSSKNRGSENIEDAPEIATVTFKDKEYYEIERVQLTWRDSSGSRGCPKAFEIQLFDGTEWKTQKSLKFSNYTNTTKTVSFDVDPTVCNRVRLVATQLPYINATDGYMLQIVEFEAFGTKCTNVALNSSVEMNVPSWAQSSYPATELVDGTVFSHNNFATTGNLKQDATESITLTLPEKSRINSVVLYPSSQIQSGVMKTIGGYPENFTIAIYNGTEWVTVKTVEGETAFPDGTALAGAEGVRYAFNSVNATKIRITATKQRTIEGTTNHALRFGEIMALGEPVRNLTTRTQKADGKTTLLTVKDAKAENFKAEIKMVYFDSSITSYGLYIGQSEPTQITGVTKIQPFRWASYAAGGLRVEGIDDNTAKYVEEDPLGKGYLEDAHSTAKYGMINKIDANGTGVMNKMKIVGFPTTFNDSNIQTLNVEALGGVLKLWWTGFEKAAWTVNLKNYEGGYISLFSRGADAGGFVSLKVQEYYEGNNIDFKQTDLEDLDQLFVASEGTSDADRVTGAKVSDYWTKGDDKSYVNASIGGKANFTNPHSFSGVAASYMIDNDVSSNNASSSNRGAEDVSDDPEIATVEFANKDYYEIDQIQIRWRGVKGCPKAFEIQLFDGTEWVTQDVLKHPEYTYTKQTVTFDIQPTVCNKVRLVATKLGTVDSATEFMLQIGEFRAFGTKCTNVAFKSSVEMNVPGWAQKDYPATKLVDGTVFSHKNFATTDGLKQDATESITLTLPEKSRINSVVLYPSSQSQSGVMKTVGGYPENFTIAIYNGTEWVTVKTVEGETAFPDGTALADAEGVRYAFEKVEATKIRITATKQRTIDGSTTSYALRFGEIMALGDILGDLTTRTQKTDGKTTLLTLKDKQLTDFKAEITMEYVNNASADYGLYFGQSLPDQLAGAKMVRPNLWSDKTYGGLYVKGIYKGSAQYVNGDTGSGVTNVTQVAGLFNYGTDSAYNKATINGFPTALTNNVQTLNVEVIDGILRVWWTGFEQAAWTTVLDDYQGGYVSLFSTGADVGGIVKFSFNEIVNRNITSRANMNIEVLGDYTIVSVTSDIAGGTLKDSEFQGTVKYDSNKYEYCTTIIQDSMADVHQNVDEAASNGSVAVNFRSYNKEAVARLYFKNKTDKIDYSDFAMANDMVGRTNGKTAETTTTLAIAYDYTNDEWVDVRDLVHAAKEGKAPEDVRKAMVGVGSEWTSAAVMEDQATVYVDAKNGTIAGTGTADSPLNSLQIATYRVADGGTICVVGTYTMASNEKTIGMGRKTITIKGKDSNAKLDLTGITVLDTNGNITIDNIKLAVGTKTLNLYANGHDFTINSNVTFDGYVKEIYAGNLGEKPLATTNMKLYGGNYGLIYGGSHSASVITDKTNLTIGGNVNRNIGFTVIDSSHSNMEIVAAYGGSRNGIVKGNTNITIQDHALLACVNGGGNGSASIVSGTCNVYVKGGETIGCHGGSLDGTVNNTNLVMTGGTTEQLFGGSWESNAQMQATAGYTVVVEGNATVTFTGGTVTRRIFGGSYTDGDKDYSYLNGGKYNLVNGTSTLNIGGTADYSHNYGGSLSGFYDLLLCAGSRFSTNSDAETSVINITTDRNSKFGSYIDKGGYGSTDTTNVVETLPQ